MQYQVTTPDGVVVDKILEVDDQEWIEHLKEKGFQLQEIHTTNVCIACEG